MTQCAKHPARLPALLVSRAKFLLLFWVALHARRLCGSLLSVSAHVLALGLLDCGAVVRGVVAVVFCQGFSREFDLVMVGGVPAEALYVISGLPAGQ